MGQHIQAKADFQHAIEIIEAGEVTANVSSAGFVADSWWNWMIIHQLWICSHGHGGSEGFSSIFLCQVPAVFSGFKNFEGKTKTHPPGWEICKPSTTETGSLPLILPQKDGTNLSEQWDPPEHAKHVTRWDAAACGTDVVIVAVCVDHIPQEMGLTTGWQGQGSWSWRSGEKITAYNSIHCQLKALQIDSSFIQIRLRPIQGGVDQHCFLPFEASTNGGLEVVNVACRNRNLGITV